MRGALAAGARAPARRRRARRQAHANALLHTDAYIRLELGRAITNSTKIYFGSSAAAMTLDFIEQFARLKSTVAP